MIPELIILIHYKGTNFQNILRCTLVFCKSVKISGVSAYLDTTIDYMDDAPAYADAAPAYLDNTPAYLA